MKVLETFIGDTENYFKPGLDPDDAKNNFLNRFEKGEYLKSFAGTKNYAFAKMLLESDTFVHYCNDRFEPFLTNYEIYSKIRSNNADFAAVVCFTWFCI